MPDATLGASLYHLCVLIPGIGASPLCQAALAKSRSNNKQLQITTA